LQQKKDKIMLFTKYGYGIVIEDNNIKNYLSLKEKNV